jgi:peptidoglycan/xylan/chitin deacetylase (PgdA/CDA1 family)
MNACTVLMYHIVDSPKSNREAALCCAPKEFAAQMEHLHRHGYAVIRLAQLVQSLRDGVNLPSKAVVITFDDGTSCTYEKAMPILRELGFPATVFVISGLVGKNNEWLRAAGFPERRMLSVEELRRLEAAGLDVGSHTVSHPRLGLIPLDQARAEVRDSKVQLEDMLGREVAYFAYPYGNYNAAVRDLALEAGYVAACSTRWGKSHAKKELFALRRIEIYGQDSLLQFALKLRLGTHNMPPLPEARSLVRRGLEAMGYLRRQYPEDS